MILVADRPSKKKKKKKKKKKILATGLRVGNAGGRLSDTFREQKVTLTTFSATTKLT